MSDGGGQWKDFGGYWDSTNSTMYTNIYVYAWVAGAYSVAKNFWTDEARTAAVTSRQGGTDGRVGGYFHGDYNIEIRASDDTTVLEQIPNVHLSKGQSFTLDFGTATPSALSNAKGQGFAVIDASNNLLSFNINENNAWKPVAEFTPAGQQIFDSVITKTMPVYNVKHTDWGAIGDGVTDDKAAIDLAITAIEAANGGILYFPTGTYKVTDFLDINNTNIIILGDGNGQSIIKASTTNAVIDYDTDDIKDKFSIIGVDIQCTQAATGTALDCVWPSTTTQLEYQNCIIRDVNVVPNRTDSATAYFSDAIKLSDAKNAIISNVFIRGNDSNVANGNGITLQGQCDFNILNSVQIRYLNTAIDVKGTTQNLIISNSGIIICNDGVDFATTSGANYYFDNIQFGSLHNKCISVTSGTPTSMIVSDCKFSKSSSSTNDWRGIDGNYDTFSITGNSFEDNGSASGTDYGVSIGSSSVNSFVIEGNVFKDIRTDGIRIAGSVVDFIICNNNISNSVNGINILIHADDFIINGNRLNTCTTGVVIAAGNSNDFTISNNNFEGCSTYITDDSGVGDKAIVGNVPPLDGTQIASASTITIPVYGTSFIITGTTNIDTINFPTHDRLVILKFQSTPTVQTTVGKLAGGAAFVATADDILTLVSISDTWYEVSRSANS
jgi:hypothetical protein